ncbi:hypothetical protein ACXZ65_33825 [Streptomyces aculeolatus]
MNLPRWLMPHRVVVEAYEGTGAYGPVYSAPVTVRCLLDEQTRMVRSSTGDEVTSTSTAYAPLSTTAPPKSRITLPDGRRTTVIAALRRDAGALPVPEHLEVQLT